MLFRRMIIGLCVLLGSAALQGATGMVLAETAERQWVSKIVSLQGRAVVYRHGQTEWAPLRLNDPLFAGDRVRVEANSRAGIVLKNDAVLRLDQNTTLVFTEIEQETTFIFKLLRGAATFFSRRPRSLKVLTPFVNGVVEGTEFYVQVDAARTRIDLFEGRILARNPFGEVLLAKGQGIVAQDGSLPQRRLLAKPRDSVQWALYYPPVLTLGLDDVPEDLKESLKWFNQGQAYQAFHRLEDIGPAAQDTKFFTYRAAVLLHLGRVSESRSDIQKALTLAPDNSDAMALKAIIAVVQNEKEQALSIAKKAVQLDSKSAPAQMALSYAQQAGFNLSGALEAGKSAVSEAPENGIVWARLAELGLSNGMLDQGVQAAQKAVALNPQTAHAHTMLGYAYLTQNKPDKAGKAFAHAITLDSAAPLPRLGLGLALIRKGDLKKGRSEIEIAAGLDPVNALIRSYLGKAYFDEKREALDKNQLDIAKVLDPNDPTPWFYDAIRKQTINQPVEALHDLQRAIELNDNRAVYRSKLLLDSDLAARSSSLARIYNNLGFQRRGLVEGWNSVNTDPTNFSAHRLLADSYAALPRHEIAMVSERLQSQLLQPVNITPIQPTLAESNLFLISSQGPSTAGLNTFNPLFNRNRATIQASSLMAGNDTWGGEGIVSGIYNHLSLSAGYSHFQSDGWQDNADQDDDIANIFGQYDISHKTNIQAEYRYRNSERGDLAQLFFEDNFAPNLRSIDEVNQGRLGFHHAFSPGSDLIGNFQFADADRFSRDFDAIFTRYDIETEEESYGGELSYLLRSHKFNIIAGGGYYTVKKDDATIVDYLGVPYFNEVVNNGVDHSNLYLYSNIKPRDNLTITVGASGDLFHPEDETALVKRDQFNPKLGISWSPFAGTTLRCAAFRVLKRTLIADQTIEPTQVVGFNQFFDDSIATGYWVYGGAIDQQFSQSMYGGLALTYRDLDVPVFFTDTGKEEYNWEEYLAHAYFFWAPQNWLSLSAEYLFEGLERDEIYCDGVKEADTHRVPIGINLFHPSGLSASLKGTFVNQSGIFENFAVGDFFDGDDDFFLLDAAISYRLPNRYGLIRIGVNNLTDQSFQYFNSDEDNLLFQPNIVFFGSIALVFP